jgi:hypothetical protein
MSKMGTRQAALIKSIRDEIKQIDDDIDAEKHTLKSPEKIDLWEVQTRLRALRTRREALQRNLDACTRL